MRNLLPRHYEDGLYVGQGTKPLPTEMWLTAQLQVATHQRYRISHQYQAIQPKKHRNVFKPSVYIHQSVKITVYSSGNA